MKPENSALTLRHWLGLLALSALSACGGAGGGGGIADGGIRGTGSSVGPVSGFGSVFVNGVQFDTSSLGGDVESDDGITCEKADQCNPAESLQKGMILRVDGEWQDDGQGRADSLEYDDTFRGKVENATPPGSTNGRGSFVILGQTINFDRQTVFKLGAGVEIVNGQFVRVSAWRTSSGEYRASFVGLVDAGTNNDIEFEGDIEAGSVSNSDSQKQFTINGVIVTFSEPVTFEGITEDELATTTQPIEVEGALNEVTGEVAAREIGLSDNRRYRSDSDEDIEFTGPINGPVTGRSFEINGLTVEVNDETVFEGLSETELAEGLLIQVEGEFLSDGITVLAEEIQLREEDSRVEATIDANSINPNAMTLSVGGVLVKVTPATVITEDDDDGTLDFGDLVFDMEIEVSGIERTNDSDEFLFLEALKIEREEGEEDGADENGEGSEFELEGRLDSFGPSSGEETIKVLGVTLVVDVVGSFGDNAGDLQFADLQEGDVLEVEYILQSNGSYFAEEVEREKDDDDDD